MSFPGFPKETFAFLEGIVAHNEKAWFDANRSLYEAGYVGAGRAFVEALGPQLRAIAPSVKFEPKINGSISRVNRDIRFSKDKRPYKDHLDLWFWTAETKSWDCPGFWFRLTAKEVYFGVGIHHFQTEQLDSFRQSVIHPRSGKALLAAVAKVQSAGDYEIGGKTRKLLPRGFSTDPDRQDYLLFEGLYAAVSLPAKTAAGKGLEAACLAHWAATWPVGQWLLDEVVG